MIVFLHLSNIVFLLSYAVKQTFWLRVLTVVAALLLFGYFIPLKLVVPIIWNIVFVSINIIKIILDVRRGLTPNNQSL